MVFPRIHLSTLLDLTLEQQTDLADALRVITSIYDQLFQCPFPYSMGLHQAATHTRPLSFEDNSEHDQFHFHFHFYPPLLRSATVKKFQVGFEMLAMPQRDLTSEEAAKRLVACLPPPTSSGF